MTIIIIKNTVVCGRWSRLKNGPTIININPSVEEIKNLGKRNMFSQKSDIKLSLIKLSAVQNRSAILNYYKLNLFRAGLVQQVIYFICIVEK